MPDCPQKKIVSNQMAKINTAFILEISDLDFAYNDSLPILRQINLTLGKNEVLGIRGANGSGKTTLFRCITGLEIFKNGKMFFLDKSIEKREDFTFVRSKTGYVLQNSENQFVFPTVMEDVAFGPLNLGFSSKEAHQIAHEALENLGISDFADKIIMNLSGGEKKLAAIAGILALRPQLLLLDEPLNELDSVCRKRLITLLKNLDCAKIIASHDEEIFTKLNCKICDLKNGKLSQKNTLAG